MEAAEEKLAWIQSRGYLRDLRPQEREILLDAEEVVDEVVKHVPLWEQGSYPQPGTVFYQMALWGSLIQLWRYECGVVVVDRMKEFPDLDLYRLYINEVLVGLIIEGRRVLDLFGDYLVWLGEQGDILNFSFI